MHCARVQTQIDAAFALAAEAGNVALMRALLRTPLAPPRLNGTYAETSPLVLACAQGRTSAVALLLRLPPPYSVDAGAHDNEALRVACAHGHTATATLLLRTPVERGVRLDAVHNAAFLCACRHGHTGTVIALLAHDTQGVIVPCDVACGFQMACDGGHLATARRLLRAPPPHTAPRLGHNASSLDMALDRMDADVTDFLLRHGGIHAEAAVGSLHRAQNTGHALRSPAILRVLGQCHTLRTAIDTAACFLRECQTAHPQPDVLALLLCMRNVRGKALGWHAAVAIAESVCESLLDAHKLMKRVWKEMRGCVRAVRCCAVMGCRAARRQRIAR
jgi:ankyrin repeat protein